MHALLGFHTVSPPTEKGTLAPWERSKESPERETKRRFSIRLCENTVLIVSGARRWLRGPVRSGPTIPLLSVPIAIDWESPKPAAGEWQPAQELSR